MIKASRALVWLLPLACCQSTPTTSGSDRELYVVRHAEAWSNVPEQEREGRNGEAADALTPRGVKQAEAVGDRLADSGVTVVFHSPLGRTQQTAEIIARRIGADCTELEALRPIGADESVSSAAQRALTALAARTELGNWAAVSHSGVTAALIGEALDRPANERLRDRLPTAGVSKLRWQADGSWRAPMTIPSYSIDDPRPQSGGFVSQVRLAEIERAGTRYILMAWEVGDVLTLGAMTQGPFEGEVDWRIGDAHIHFSVDAESGSGKVPVTASAAPNGVEPLSGERAGFRDFRWTNVELRTSQWLSERSGALSVSFRANDGAVVSLPPAGAYAMHLAARTRH